MRIRKNKKICIRAKRIFLFALAFLCVTLLLSCAFEKTEPLILPLAQNLLKDKVTNIIYDTIGNYDLSNIISPVYSNDGKISSIQTNAAEINCISNEIVTSIEKELGDKDINIKVPIGDVIGDSLSLGQGPYIVIQLNQYKATNINIKSEFTENGINQTLHRLTLELCVESVVLMPGLKTEKIKADITLPLSETLVVAQIPNIYAENNSIYPVK